MEEQLDKPFCNVPTDGTCITFQEVLQLKDCKFPPGMCFGLQEIIVDKHGHEVDGDWKKDKHGNWVARDGECEHPDTPEYKAEHAKKHKVVPKEVATASSTDTFTSTETQISTSVEIAKTDPVVPKKQPASMDATITLIVGALSGIAGPMVMNLLKNLLKNKFSKKKPEQKQEEEQEEPTDCKTHQLKSNAKIVALSKRLTALESKPVPQKTEDSSDVEFDTDKVSDLAERIEKLEKLLQNKKR